jgi:ketosteroid isomerase-like protein
MTTTDKNLDIVRRGYAAFSAGDVATLSELIASDAVHVVPGNGPISGAHKGQESILTMYGDLAKRSNNTMKVELQDLLSNGSDQVVGVHRATAQREGKKLDQREVLVFTINNGKIVEIRDFFTDIAAQDAFWA